MTLAATDLAAFTAALELLDKDTKSEQWRHDGALWVKDQLDEFLWSKQIEIINSVRDNRYTAVKACHGPGKVEWPPGSQRGGWKPTLPARPR